MSDSIGVAIENHPQMPEVKNKTHYSLFFKQIISLVTPYWRSEEKYMAWGMLIAVLALNMTLIYCAVLINTWNGNFYDALQRLDKSHFSSLLAQFFLLVTFYIIIAVSSSFLEAYLGFKWRIWLTKQIMNDWLHNSTFCKLFTYKTKTENPDQRISQDIASFTSSTLSLSLNIITQLIKGITFAFILWKLSSALTLPLPGGANLNIPGYMLWLTIIYVTFSTFVIYKSGKPMVALDYTQEKVEADFRFSLMRIRERRDEVSMLSGAKAETALLNKNISSVVKNYKQIILRNIYVNSFQNLFNNFTTILPVLAAAPMFFSGAITLGILMQIANAFGQVEGSLMIFALNFQAFASWKATLNRIVDFRTEMAELAPKVAANSSELNMNRSVDHNELHINNLTLHLPHLTNLSKFDFHIKPQEHVLIMGRSGLGKSTLLKCIAGHWPYASGSIKRPEDITIIPQKPYFPISTLRDSLLYPNLEHIIDDQEIKRILNECALDHLQQDLYIVHDWNAILSLGEQQRLNIARVIISKPKWLILDEPTASMDKALEARLFQALYKELPDVTLVTIGHAPSLKDLHTRCIEF